MARNFKTYTVNTLPDPFANGVDVDGLYYVNEGCGNMSLAIRNQENNNWIRQGCCGKIKPEIFHITESGDLVLVGSEEALLYYDFIILLNENLEIIMFGEMPSGYEFSVEDGYLVLKTI